MQAAAEAMVDAGRSTSLFDLRDELGKCALTARVWAQALAQQDELATELFDLAIDTLGIGIASAVNLVDVELVVVGGGLAEKLGQDLADRIAAAATPWLLQPHPELRFLAAALGDDSGIVGAGTQARALAEAGT